MKILDKLMIKEYKAKKAEKIFLNKEFLEALSKLDDAKQIDESNGRFITGGVILIDAVDFPLEKDENIESLNMEHLSSDFNRIFRVLSFPFKADPWYAKDARMEEREIKLRDSTIKKFRIKVPNQVRIYRIGYREYEEDVSPDETAIRIRAERWMKENAEDVYLEYQKNIQIEKEELKRENKHKFW